MSVLWSMMRPLPGTKGHQSPHTLRPPQHLKPQSQSAKSKPAIQTQKPVHQSKLQPSAESTKVKKTRKLRKTKASLRSE